MCVVAGIAEQRSNDAGVDAFAQRVLAAAAGAFEVFGIYIGDRLGYYQALRDGALDPAGLARRTATDERYAREWLEQQAVVGILEADGRDDAAGRRFRLPSAHAEVLADADSLNFLAPVAQMIAGAVTPLERVLQAYRTGGGVPYEAFGAEFRTGQGRVNRAMFLQQLGADWLPAMPDVHARLSRPGARVADIGCGVGWSSIGIARYYPHATVHGFDSDVASIESARTFAAEAGAADRVTFHTAEIGAGAARHEPYDLVIALECVHDMTRPVDALREMRAMAGAGGAVVVIDERVAHEFQGEGGDVEWLMYGWSILHCLPVGMNDPGAAGTGTVMRPATLEGYAREAGFAAAEVLPIDNMLFRFYRLS